MSNLLCCLPQGIASFWHLLSWNLVHSFLIGKKLYSIFNYHSNSAVICSLCTKWKSQIRWKHNVALKEMKFLASADFWIYCFDKKNNASTPHATDAVLILLHTMFRVTLLMGDMLCHKMNGDNNRILSSDCRYSCQTDCLRADQIDLENWWEIDDFKDSSTTEETASHQLLL